MEKLTCLLLVLFGAGLTVAGTARAQQMRTLHDNEWCDQGWDYDNDGERFCEVREITLPAGRARIAVDGGANGDIKIEGWSRNEIRVRARVTTHARTESDAERLAQDVDIQTDRTLSADVPETKRRESVSVNFDVRVPRQSNLSLKTYNGDISIENIAGEMNVEALNGGLRMNGLAGDVRGRTTNGSVKVELTGDAWDGDGLDVRTTNGSVKIYVPEGYSADLETSTVNGKVEVDFPITVQGRIDSRIATKLGNGGKPIHVRTTNGSVKVRRD